MFLGVIERLYEVEMKRVKDSLFNGSVFVCVISS